MKPMTVDAEKDYQPDFGKIFGLNGKSFGWSADMTPKMKQRMGFSKPYLETLAEFPPSVNSRLCTKSTPENVCEPVTWMIKVGKGRYHIKLFVGDASMDVKADLKINKRPIVKNRVILKNTLEMFEDIIEADENQMLEISSDCEENCEHAMSKINAIEISPHEETSDDLLIKKTEKETKCGSAYLGGRCDTGPNVLHCIYDDPSSPSAKFCNGPLVLASIPENYVCKEQVGQYKCVNKVYTEINDCKRFCPKQCLDNKCIH